MVEENKEGSEDELQTESEILAPEFGAKSAPVNRENAGPYDSSEVTQVKPYIDLGSIKVLPKAGMQMRLDIEEKSKRIVAATMDYQDSSLQVQAFAAPRTGGLWHEIRNQLKTQIAAQGSMPQEANGPFGLELIASIPVPQPEGGVVMMPTRFIGVDGPKWFLRGVIRGKAALAGEDANKIEDLFRSLVVVRGQQPFPPRELLPLQLPNQKPTEGQY